MFKSLSPTHTQTHTLTYARTHTHTAIPSAEHWGAMVDKVINPLSAMMSFENNP